MKSSYKSFAMNKYTNRLDLCLRWLTSGAGITRLKAANATLVQIPVIGHRSWRIVPATFGIMVCKYKEFLHFLIFVG